MKLHLGLILVLKPYFAVGQEAPKVPEDLLHDKEYREEQGLNEFTVPSIVKIFDELEKISPLSYSSEHLKRHERLPIDRSKLAMRLGTLIADGFIAVQTGHSEDVPKIATHLSRYAKALGAGDRIKRHAAALLEHAENKDLQKLKDNLAKTQQDVELELLGLRDSDLSILISLGGWLQALEAASNSVSETYATERALQLYREDIADYYTETLGSLNPSISELPHIIKMRTFLSGLRSAMTLAPEEIPTEMGVQEIKEVANQLAVFARQ